MPTSKAIKEVLNFLQSMEKLIAALKEIDASHFQSFVKKKDTKFQDFDSVIKDFLRFLHGIVNVLGIDDTLLKPAPGRCGIIVFTSDASFMGKLNNAICDQAVKLMAKKRDVEFIILGKKGLGRLRYTDAHITSFQGIVENRRYEQASKVREYVYKQRLDGKLGDLYMVYARCLSFGKQDAEVIQLLPATALFQGSPKLEFGKWQEICLESDVDKIVDYLVDNWIGRNIYEAAYESKLAEYAARTMQLEGSLDYLRNEVRKCALSYNKARQGETDTAMREVFAALLGSGM